MNITVVYRGCCPKCGGEIDSIDIDNKCCRRCLNSSSLSKITALDVLNREVDNLINFFVKLTNFYPWTLQRYWIKRLVSGESFAMVAPTGIGKSTLLAVYALYRAHIYGSKVYIVTPTREIAKQMYKRILEFIEKGRLDGIKLVFYDSADKNVSNVKNAIKNNEFNILITSAAFLSRHQDLLIGKKFDVIIADDLDSIMKNSKSVDRVLMLLGFTNDDIELALRITKLRQNMIMIKLSKNQEVAERYRKELMEYEAILRNSIAKKNVQLVVASATGRARGLKVQILKLLLGFDAGAVFEYWRNITDLHHILDNNSLDLVTELVKKLGSGIIFVSSLYKDLINDLVEKLEKSGIRVSIAKSGNKAVDRFRRGEVDVIIGTASYYGILVRGLDEPIRTRYVIFIGIPTIVRDIYDSLANIRLLYIVLRELRRLGYEVNDLLKSIIEIITSSTPSMLYLYTKLLRQKTNNMSISDDIRAKAGQLNKIRDHVYSIIVEVLDRTKILEIGKSFIMTKRGNRYLILKPDPYTYIQASGRCSRLLKGGKTFGVSIVFDEYLELVIILESILKRYIHTFNIKKLDLTELDHYVEEIEKSRSGSSHSMVVDIATALIIVESPTKVKTIANMFGRPAKRIFGNTYVYETLIPITSTNVIVASIVSSLGHITDLVTDEGLYGIRVNGSLYIPVYDFITRCKNCGAQHVGIHDICPYCGSIDIISSSSIYNIMRALAIQVDRVFIATDPDTEGEKIAYDIYNLLKPYNKNIHRIEFREITRNAILEALRNPKTIDIKKVEAQIARRIIDRWIGFEVSMQLQMRFDKPWLGAGRVQTPVLLWVTSRYKEYKDNLGYIIVADIGGYRVRLYIGKAIEARDKAVMLSNIISKNGLEIESIDIIEKEIPPPSPFTTDSLIQEANILLGFSASKTMTIAQSLFELGLITYHRTDSVRLSSLGLAIAQDALKKLGLGNMFSPRTWSRADNREDAHEAIRPTSPINVDELIEMIIKGEIGFATRISEEYTKLYDLIFRRFVASQMSSAIVRYLVMSLAIEGFRTNIELPIEIITPGFTLVYPLKLYTDILKNIDRSNNKLRVLNVDVIKGSSVALYRVADIVRLMKEKGIGRPSTYSKAIDNNIRHGYIIMSKKKKLLIPTKLGLEIAEVINNYFIDLVGEKVTRELEEILDNIELGKTDIHLVINSIRSHIDTTIKSYQLIETITTIQNIASTTA